MREALRDALADSKSFLTQVPSIPTDDNRASCPQCHMVQQQVPWSSLLRICSSKTTSMTDLCTTQGTWVYTHWENTIDSGSALSIIPKRLLYFLGIPLSKLSTTTTTIYGLNARSSHPLGKIHLRYQIGDLKFEVTCYVIDADTSYNLLLGRPWIFANWIVPSTLHQWFKYVDDKVMVRMVYAETQPFKRVANNFSDSLLYKANSKVAKEQLPGDIDMATKRTQN